MSFDLDGYVDVAERIAVFKAQYPDGVLQSEVTLHADPPGWLCKAYAYRTADDVRPGIGHAFEPVPGKTPYTRDSEAMNAETSAWGRAIVALGFETKKIASANEVRSRSSAAPAFLEASEAGSEPDNKEGLGGGSWRWTSGKHQGKTLAETDRDYIEWYAQNGPKADVKLICRDFLADDGVPF